MNISNMKNIIVLRNLPSNLVDEAIVVLKENKKVKKYQYADDIKGDNVDKQKKKEGKTADNTKEYIIKEAELVVNNYLSNLKNKKEVNPNDRRRKTIRGPALLRRRSRSQSNQTPLPQTLPRIQPHL